MVVRPANEVLSSATGKKGRKETKKLERGCITHNIPHQVLPRENSIFSGKHRMNILSKPLQLLTCLSVVTVMHCCKSKWLPSLLLRSSPAELEESFKKTRYYPNCSIPLLVNKTNSRSSTDEHMASNYTEFCLICC